ncbi:hypothetical protein BZG35_13545 [Brevundimonas sp. LM2]|uniref:response regulator n=1 Tax=Brevundimonas sp. LM2 TaxID=1938605 RepID=UPI0009839842|nr:response regulator [Brevundimonas sp. LM2]AQR62555.1 hypothetical protein BZG35_13545 [Brevundimonas sp. LM2]
MTIQEACPNDRKSLAVAVGATMTLRVGQRLSRFLFAFATALAFGGLAGVPMTVVWLAAFLLLQGIEILLFPDGAVRSEKDGRLALALFLSNKLTFALFAVPIAVYGGLLGITVGMMIISGALIHAVVITGSSRFMAGAAALPPLIVLAAFPPIMLATGLPPYSIFVVTVAGLLLCAAAYRAWHRVAEDMCALHIARRAADHASQAKSDFLTMISHEIRTPLNGVMGMAQSLANDALTASQSDRLDTLISSGNGLQELLDEVLDLGRIESDQLSLQATAFNLRDLVQRSIEPFRAVAHDKGLDIDVSLCPGLASAYIGDPVRIRQVVHNLVSNAMQLTQVGGILVSASRDVEGVRLSVCDSGPGMPDALLARVFDRQFAPDLQTPGGTESLGLSLFIANKLVERMAGSIAATHRIPHGLCLTATLPLAIAEPLVALPPSLPRPVQLPGSMRVLVAEDHPVNRRVLALLLEQIDVAPTMVENGLEAVEACRKEDWDLVLMDIQMPVLGGVAAARRIRDEAAAAGRIAPPIIAVTANVMAHQLQVYAEAGMTLCVPKPVEGTNLFETMHAALNKSVQSFTVNHSKPDL